MGDESKTAAPARAVKQAAELWCAEKRIDAWKFGAAKALRRWPIGAEVSESEFDQAIYDACNHVIR